MMKPFRDSLSIANQKLKSVCSGMGKNQIEYESNELYLEEAQAFNTQQSMLVSDDVDGHRHFSGKRHFDEPKNSLRK